MTERSRPWDGTVTGDAGPYSDDQWTDVWATFQGPRLALEGVFRDVDNQLVASIAGGVSPVTIATGKAVVDGIWYETDDNVTQAIPDASAGNVRVDRIVLRKDWATQTVRIARVVGTEVIPPALPQPDPLTQVDQTTWEIPLWQVHVTDAGVLTLHADDRIYVGQYNPVGGSPTRIYLEDDFLEGTIYVNAETRRIWEASMATAGSINRMTPDADIVAGGLTFRYAGAGTGEEALLRTGEFGIGGTMNADVEIRLKSPNAVANLDRIVGFVSTFSLTPTDGVFFRQQGVANWFGVTRSGGVETTAPVDMGVSATDVIKRLRFRMFSNECVAFFLDDVFVGAVRDNIPSPSFIRLQLGILDDGGGSAIDDYMEVDWIRVQGDR